ncbi:hypothetical protein GCM10027289_30090 [Tsukamurella serpentis]
MTVDLHTGVTREHVNVVKVTQDAGEPVYIYYRHGTYLATYDPTTIARIVIDA